MLHRLITAFAFVAYAQTSIGQTPSISFSRGDAAMALPPGYTSKLEDSGDTLVIFPALKSFELRVTFHSLAQYTKQRPTIAKDFVSDTAQKQGRSLFQLDTNNSIGYMDPPKHSTDQGPPSQHTHGILSLDQGYATFTLSFEDKDIDQPDVRWIRGQGLLELLGRLRYVGA